MTAAVCRCMLLYRSTYREDPLMTATLAILTVFDTRSIKIRKL